MAKTTGLCGSNETRHTRISVISVWAVNIVKQVYVPGTECKSTCMHELLSGHTRAVLLQHVPESCSSSVLRGHLWTCFRDTPSLTRTPRRTSIKPIYILQRQNKHQRRQRRSKVLFHQYLLDKKRDWTSTRITEKIFWRQETFCYQRHLLLHVLKGNISTWEDVPTCKLNVIFP